LGASRTAFAGNQVPLSRISSISQKIVNLIPQPTLGDLANNYYATAPFRFDRHNADTKVNWNPGEKLSVFGRFGMLHYETFNPQVFGDALGGPPTSGLGGNPGNGEGYTYNFTAGATYILTPTFIVDAHYGYTRQDTNSQQPRLDEQVGLNFLGIPGTNGPGILSGGWPRFAVDNYTTLGINEDYMPYFKSDPQFQYVANGNWTKGTHNIRFGVDMYRQHLNQTQQQLIGGGFVGGQGAFAFSGGPTTVRGGPSSNQFNSFATFLLGLPTQIGKLHLVPDRYRVRAWLHSYYFSDRWNVNRKLTMSYGVRWEYFPYANRGGGAGLERYDPDTNKMLVCGTGDVPADCGVEVSKTLFSPRLGLAYRATDTFVVRAGYGITNDPFSITEPMRMNYPTQLALNISGANSFQPAGTLEKGIPPLVAPALGNGIIDVPIDAVLATAPKKVNRGYVQSWNLTVQKNLKGGFTAQAGYIATRQIRQFGFFDLNAGQVLGGGQSGRPLVRRFGRTATTTQYYYPVGSSQYNALQATLERRFSNGLQIGANYTWSKSIGITDGSEQTPSIQALQYYSLNRAVSNFDRTQNLAMTSVLELPFGKNKKFLNQGGALSAIAGGWQVNNIVSLMTGAPFSITASGTSLDLPGSTQRADQVKPTVQKLGAAGRSMSFFDPLAFAPVTSARFGNSGFYSMRGPGIANWDFSLFRQFQFNERFKLQFRAESFNLTNTPHFANPGNNVSNRILNMDGSVRSLGGFSEVTSTISLGREGFDERQFRFGLRLSF